MNVEAYIESGILELYALGLVNEMERSEVEQMIAAHPEIKVEFDAIQHSMERYAFSNAVLPPAGLQQKIEKTIVGLEKERTMDLEDLPLITGFSDYNNWLRLVSHDIPDKLEDGRFCKVLRESGNLMQMLLVSSTDFEDEIHQDLYESFLILKGKCQCTVGDHTFFMEAGDYTGIPLHQIHNVKVISPTVVAILQRISLNNVTN